MERVLHILNTATFSGAENVAITIIRNFNSKDYECAYLSLDGVIRDKVEGENIKFYGLKKLTILSIKKVVNDFKPSVIHAHDFKASFLASFLHFKGKIISHIHNNNPFMRKWTLKSFLYYTRLKKFDKVLGVSDSILNECVYSEKLKNRYITVSNPVDINRVINSVSTFDKIYDIVFVGRLTEQKNPLRFVEVISKIVKDNKNLRCAMVGDGNLIELTRQTVLNKNLSDNIKMFGFIDNPYEIMAKSNVLFLTSKWEGFGLVVVEAMALGLPVASAPVGGVPNIIQGNSGRLCNSDQEFVEFFNCLQDRCTYIEYSKAARARACELGNIEQYTQNIMNIYNS